MVNKLSANCSIPPLPMLCRYFAIFMNVCEVNMKFTLSISYSTDAYIFH